MSERSFTLVPFPAPAIPEISLHGTFSLDVHVLTLRYVITGHLESLLLPPISPSPSRRDELWKSTCLEFFLAGNDQPVYWEFNLSPSGDWNVYRMDAYRRIGFREEPAISQLPFVFEKELAGYTLDVSVDLAPLITPGDGLQMGIAAIVQTQDRHETYWALTHPAPQPDFHLRESFILSLAPQTLPSAQSALDG